MLDTTLDLSTIIGPLDKEPEPKTLLECYEEIGTFPFVARTVLGVEEVQVVSFGPDHHDCLRGKSFILSCGRWVNPCLKRWTLVGHRT